MKTEQIKNIQTIKDLVKSIETIKDLDSHIDSGSILVHISENGMSEIEYIDKSTYSFNFINARFTDNFMYMIKLEDIYFIK